MYGSLRTNLPKEIMAFNPQSLFPASDHSFLTHTEVQAYLVNYAKQHELYQYIHFNCNVVKVYKDNEHNQSKWMIISENILTKEKSICYYDALVVCNGHFDLPYIPTLPAGWSEYFKGVSYHSNEYDRVKDTLVGRNVLVVGANSSGTDIARELVSIAKTVYVSVRSQTHTTSTSNVSNSKDSSVLPIVVPAITSVSTDGALCFADGSCVTGIDVVVWCTGYCWNMMIPPVIGYS